MISKKFFKASFIYTVIGALPLVSSVVLLPFYTNFLNTSDFGLLALYIAFTMFIQILVNVNFDSALSLYYYDYYKTPQKLNELVSTVAISLILFGSVCSLFFIFSGNLIFDFISKDQTFSFFPYGIMSIVTAICNSFFRTYTSLLIIQEKVERFFWVNTLNFVLTVGISLVGLYMYQHTLIGPMWGRLLSGIGIFSTAAFFIYKEFGIHFKLEFIKKILPYSLPLLSYSLISWALSYADIYIINRYITVSDVGVFDFAIKCTLLIDFSLNALSSAIAPKLYSIWAKLKINHSTPEVNRYFNAFTAIIILTVALNIFIIPLGVPLIVRKTEYYEAFKFLPFIALSYVGRGLYMMYLNPIYFFKKTKLLPPLYLILAVIKIALSIFFIKLYGLWGAIIILLFIKIVEIFILTFAARKTFIFKFNKLKLIVLPIGYVVLVIILEQFTGIINPHLLHFISLLIAAFAVTWIYKNEIKVTALSLMKR